MAMLSKSQKQNFNKVFSLKSKARDIELAGKRTTEQEPALNKMWSALLFSVFTFLKKKN